jgi:hypothetical protein
MRTYITAPLCLFIAATVVLASLHAGQLVGAIGHYGDNDKKITHEDAAAKVARDLHHHSDKSGAQFIKDVGDQQYADNRSLRGNRDKKESLRNRLAERFSRALQSLSLIDHLN